MQAQGKTLREIRIAIDEKWGKRGPATKTPLPPAGI
jgi:hypothetical protein